MTEYKKILEENKTPAIEYKEITTEHGDTTKLSYNFFIGSHIYNIDNLPRITSFQKVYWYESLRREVNIETKKQNT